MSRTVRAPALAPGGFRLDLPPQTRKQQLFLLRVISRKWLLLFAPEGYSIGKMAAIPGSPVTVARAPIFFPSDFSISASVFTASCLP
jgi:hypothetical protein